MTAVLMAISVMSVSVMKAAPGNETNANAELSTERKTLIAAGAGCLEGFALAVIGAKILQESIRMGDHNLVASAALALWAGLLSERFASTMISSDACPVDQKDALTLKHRGFAFGVFSGLLFLF